MKVSSSPPCRLLSNIFLKISNRILSSNLCFFLPSFRPILYNRAYKPEERVTNKLQVRHFYKVVFNSVREVHNVCELFNAYAFTMLFNSVNHYLPWCAPWSWDMYNNNEFPSHINWCPPSFFLCDLFDFPAECSSRRWFYTLKPSDHQRTQFLYFLVMN